jgi:DNA polymerase
MLSRMGIGPVWVERDPAAVAIPVEPLEAHEPVATELPTLPAQDLAQPVASVQVPGGLHTQTLLPAQAVTAQGLDWNPLEQTVAGCTACGLCQGRKRTVFGVGDRNASWLFVGEGPGRQEDIKGEPFVGPAGKLLDNMLKALGLNREADAYIANVVKCRPTADDGRDRPPTPEEIAACLPYLQQQLQLIQPDVIVALGRIAAISLLGLPPDTPVSSLRGKVHQFQGKPLIVTYHPAYLLRTPADKAKVWRDLCMARSAHAGQS